MNARELEKLLLKAGWEACGQEGSHKKFKHPNKKGIIIVVPMHSGDLKSGLAISILKKADISPKKL